MESRMGVQSNLDEVQRQPVLTSCAREWQWACRKGGDCIPRYDVCDGIPQCPDGSDEWNCDSFRNQQESGYAARNGVPGTIAKPPTTPVPTTSTAAQTSYVVISTHQLFFTFVVFAVLALIVVMYIRRRARTKAVVRNRRGNFLQAQDSDEDDVLISSMYS